jgi:methionyl-tRNA synthetase
MSEKPKFSVTTPLYYVNDLPHIGSAYTTIAADAIARFARLQGKSVLLITGTDEHGQKIERTAASLERSPQAHCDAIAAGFADIWQKLNIQYDRFSRTTAPNHLPIVKEFFQRVWERGDIYTGQQKGLYCVGCEEFKEERELKPGKKCPLHPNIEVEWRDEENYFFRLSKYQDRLEKLYLEKPDFIQPETRKHEVTKFVQQGLQDFSISRINVAWGLPIPVDPKHTIYVWFDALIGYITALLDPKSEPSLDLALSKWWPINLHLIGKDILRFHAIYWPAMLMSAELPLPDKIFAHGFLTKDGQKMGKTLGNTVDPQELLDRFGSEAVRYYFLKEIEFGQDGDYSETRFIDIVNADLADDLGNLLNRTFGMIRKYCGGKVPKADIPEDYPLKSVGLTLGDRVVQNYSSLNFSQACADILALVKASNKLIDKEAPWALYKQGDTEGVARILYSCLESARLAAYLLSPITPNLSNQIYQQLGFQIDFNDPERVNISAPFHIHSTWGILTENQILGEPKPVFTKLELIKSP